MDPFPSDLILPPQQHRSVTMPLRPGTDPLFFHVWELSRHNWACSEQGCRWHSLFSLCCISVIYLLDKCEYSQTPSVFVHLSSLFTLLHDNIHVCTVGVKYKCATLLWSIHSGCVVIFRRCTDTSGSYDSGGLFTEDDDSISSKRGTKTVYCIFICRDWRYELFMILFRVKVSRCEGRKRT